MTMPKWAKVALTICLMPLMPIVAILSIPLFVVCVFVVTAYQGASWIVNGCPSPDPPPRKKFVA